LYSRFITLVYQGSSGRGAAGTRRAVAKGQGQRGRRGCGKGRMRSRSVGRESGGPSFSLSAARSPSLPAFRSGGGRRRRPFPPHTAGATGRPAAAARCGGAEARRGGGGRVGWTHKESWARASATRNGHRGQPRMHTALSRFLRAQCSCRVGFLRWVAEAAVAPFVVSTRRPSRGSIAAPIPRSPASGGARRRGFGLHTVGGGERWEQPVGALGAEGQHRWLHSTHSAPLLRLDKGGLTPEHGCGGGGPAAIVLRVCALRRGRAAAVAAAAAARW
jgi:hypothetical protein